MKKSSKTQSGKSSHNRNTMKSISTKNSFNKDYLSNTESQKGLVIEPHILPDGWTWKKFEDVCEIVGGSQPSKNKFIYHEKEGYIRLVQVRDYRTDKYITYIPKSEAKRVCTKDDIMIGRYGPPIFGIFRGIEGAYNVALMKAIPLDIITNRYLYYTLKRDDLFRYIELLSRRSSGQTGVDLAGLKAYLIALPPLPEQQAIATALSDVDGLIFSLTKLIDKKKNIKQGAMQELLTGKKRLDGFSGDWVEVKLGDVANRVTTGKLDANAMKPNGQFRFYTCAKDYYWIDEYAFDDEALLVSGNGANVGYIHYYKGKFNAYQRTYVITGFSENVKYIKVFLEKYLADRINAEVNSGNTPYIKMDTLTDMFIKFPPKPKEQAAIATVLSDMDSEIEALEQKLIKYNNIKQGMMQELLTGRIRLIEEVM